MSKTDHVLDLLRRIPDFYTQQCRRCADLEIDCASLDVSHVAIRTRTWRDYLKLREPLEELATGNLENVWNGRPISKLLLREPIEVGNTSVSMIELIPPFHLGVYKMGLEHVGLVVGPGIDAFGGQHRGALTGQQFQSSLCAPYYVRFPDSTHVKFYRVSLEEICRGEGNHFDSFDHASWQPEDELAGPYASA